MLKSQGSAKSPQDVAQEIASNLEFAETFVDKVRFGWAISCDDDCFSVKWQDQGSSMLLSNENMCLSLFHSYWSEVSSHLVLVRNFAA